MIHGKPTPKLQHCINEKCYGYNRAQTPILLHLKNVKIPQNVLFDIIVTSSHADLRPPAYQKRTRRSIPSVQPVTMPSNSVSPSAAPTAQYLTQQAARLQSQLNALQAQAATMQQSVSGRSGTMLTTTTTNSVPVILPNSQQNNNNRGSAVNQSLNTSNFFTTSSNLGQRTSVDPNILDGCQLVVGFFCSMIFLLFVFSLHFSFSFFLPIFNQVPSRVCAVCKWIGIRS